MSKIVVRFGVCCLFVNSNESGGTVSINNSYVQNPKFPAAYANTTAVNYDVITADPGNIR